jgi:Flp pilus assembly protein TadD
MTMNTMPVRAIALALLLSGCGSWVTQNDVQSRQAEAEIEMAKRRLAGERAEIDNPGMYRTLIEQMQTQGLYFASLAHIDAYAQRFGLNDELALRRADAQRETGQEDLATAGYRQLLNGAVASKAWHGLGLIAGRQGRMAEAIAALREAQARDPINAIISSDLAYALMRTGAVEEARVPVLRAGELAPQNRQVLSNIALYLFASGRADRAEAMMQKMEFPETVQQSVRRDALAIRVAAQRPPVPAPAPVSTSDSVSASPEPRTGLAGIQQDRLLERFAPRAQ